MKTWKPFILLSGLLAAFTAAAFDAPGSELLEPDKAFAFTAEVGEGTSVEVTWDIADGYYMYRDRIRFSSDTPGITLGEPELPPGKIKDDEFFGRIAVYRNRVTATIPFTHTGDAPEGAGEMRQVTVAQKKRDFRHALAGVVQHPCRGLEPDLIQHLGIVRARCGKSPLQTASTHITQPCSEFDVQIAFLNIAEYDLPE